MALACTRLNCGYTCIQSGFANVWHVAKHHLGQLVTHLDYETICSRFGQFPRYLMKCSHPGCDFRVKEGGVSGNATTKMKNHLIEQHGGQHGARKGFRFIEDPREVRSEFFHDLPELYACRLCEPCVEMKRPERLRHLISHHWSDLFRVK